MKMRYLIIIGLFSILINCQTIKDNTVYYSNYKLPKIKDLDSCTIKDITETYIEYSKKKYGKKDSIIFMLAYPSIMVRRVQENYFRDTIKDEVMISLVTQNRKYFIINDSTQYYRLLNLNDNKIILNCLLGKEACNKIVSVFKNSELNKSLYYKKKTKNEKNTNGEYFAQIFTLNQDLKLIDTEAMTQYYYNEFKEKYNIKAEKINNLNTHPPAK